VVPWGMRTVLLLGGLLLASACASKKDRPAAIEEQPPLLQLTTGIKECDDYYNAMADCLANLPSETANQARESLKTSMAVWKNTPEDGKSVVAEKCTMLREVAKGAYAIHGCTRL
jgi:hypothetical protein